MASRFFNARIWSQMGWNNPAIEYLRLNDTDTTQVITDLAAHIAAADPHPQYETTAEVQTRINTQTFLLMGA
jgi:hypothetical protein